MSYRTQDRLIFGVVLFVLISQVGEMNFWMLSATGWALGRWLAVLMEEWEEG